MSLYDEHPMTLARCLCDEAIRPQGSRWVHLTARSFDHPAEPAPPEIPEPLAVEVYRGREFLRVCRRGVNEAMDFIRRIEGPPATIRLERGRRRITAYYGPRVGATYDLLSMSTKAKVTA